MNYHTNNYACQKITLSIETTTKQTQYFDDIGELYKCIGFYITKRNTSCKLNKNHCSAVTYISSLLSAERFN